MRPYVALLTMAICLAAFHQFSDGCSCWPEHPQEQYCKSDFVILARIKRVRTFNDSRIYKVRVRKEYKLSEKALVALKSGRLLTAAYDAMCGVYLAPGKLYAISGRVVSLKAHINLCGMAVLWEDLTRRQRKGLKMMYKHGCSCAIKRCPSSNTCRKDRNACSWYSDCQLKEGVCLRQASKNCMWTRNSALAKCLKNDSLTISRWSG